MTVQQRTCAYMELDRGLKCKLAEHADNKHHLVAMTDAEKEEWHRIFDGSVPTAPLGGKTGTQVERQAGHGMIGGTHYKKLEIDPWMVIKANGMGYFDGNALKYIMRFRHKDGLQDLKKAQHYLEELIRQEEAREALGEALDDGLHGGLFEPLGLCETRTHQSLTATGAVPVPHAQRHDCLNWSSQ